MAVAPKFRVPKGQEPVLHRLISLDDDVWRPFVSALGGTRPSLVLEDFAGEVSGKTQLSRTEASELVSVLAVLYTVRERLGDAFYPALREALNAATIESLHLNEDRWLSFKGRLNTVLSLDHSLGVTAKALEIRAENQHTYCHSRVITDVRPVFAAKPGSSPLAVMPIHTLKLAFHEGSQVRDCFVVMDRKDVEELKRMLERALEKEQSLREYLSGMAALWLED